MNEVNELKPCPFCGGEAKIRSGLYGLNGYQIGCKPKPTQCICPGCISISQYYWGRGMAIKAWNRRA